MGGQDQRNIAAADLPLLQDLADEGVDLLGTGGFQCGIQKEITAGSPQEPQLMAGGGGKFRKTQGLHPEIQDEDILGVGHVMRRVPSLSGELVKGAQGVFLTGS